MVSPVLILLLLCSVCCQLGESRTFDHTDKGNTTALPVAKTRKLVNILGKGGISATKLLVFAEITAALAWVGILGRLIYLSAGTSSTCRRCIKAHKFLAGSIEDACVSSTTTCQSYFIEMHEQCNVECPRKEIMKPVHSYLYKIRQQEAGKYYEIIEAANSTKELAPAVEYAKQLKVLEISRGFFIGKKLSKDITKAIEARKAVLAKQA